MPEARNNMVAYTEVDQLQVAALAFTGSANDQRSYLKTIASSGKCAEYKISGEG